MSPTMKYVLGAVVLIIIIYIVYLTFYDNGSTFVGAMAKDDHNVRLAYPLPAGRKTGWLFNRGNYV